jgi:hypothetical protein
LPQQLCATNWRSSTHNPDEYQAIPGLTIITEA